jgi:hypothetical protein
VIGGKTGIARNARKVDMATMRPKDIFILNHILVALAATAKRNSYVAGPEYGYTTGAEVAAYLNEVMLDGDTQWGQASMGHTYVAQLEVLGLAWKGHPPLHPRRNPSKLDLPTMKREIKTLDTGPVHYRLTQAGIDRAKELSALMAKQLAGLG